MIAVHPRALKMAAVWTVQRDTRNKDEQQQLQGPNTALSINNSSPKKIARFEHNGLVCLLQVNG